MQLTTFVVVSFFAAWEILPTEPPDWCELALEEPTQREAYPAKSLNVFTAEELTFGPLSVELIDLFLYLQHYPVARKEAEKSETRACVGV